MIEAAEKQGKINKDTTIIEPPVAIRVLHWLWLQHHEAIS